MVFICESLTLQQMFLFHQDLPKCPQKAETPHPTITLNKPSVHMKLEGTFNHLAVK